MDKLKDLVITIAILLVLVFSGYYFWSKSKIHDVIEPVKYKSVDTITVDSLIYIRDTVIIPPGEIDTSEIIRKYFSSRDIDTTVVNVYDKHEIKIRFTGNLYENSLRNVTFSTESVFLEPKIKPKIWALSAGIILGPEMAMPVIAVRRKRSEIILGKNFINQSGVFIGYKHDLLIF